MSTSIHSGLVAFAASLYGTDDDPVDTAIVRDGIANGVLHAADSMAQVRCNILMRSADFFTIAASPSGSTWYRIQGSPFGEWPLTLHADGTPYRLRIRVGVAASSATSCTITFRIVVSPDTIARDEMALEADHVYELAFNPADAIGTTPTHVPGTSQGSIASATLLTVTRERASQWLKDVSVYDAVSSGTPRTIQQCMVSPHVFVKTTNSTCLPRLHALHIAEYVGT
jgi:hypothetical protein